MSEVYDATVCALGEGPLWHPERDQLYWFDIIRHRLLAREQDKTRIVQFGEHVSAAGWVSADELLIASETRLFLFNLETEIVRDVASLEADTSETRSNDGRADPWGGFWIGTMGKSAEPGAGAIYRYYRGELRKLYSDITISNAICFPPDRPFAHWTDTKLGKIMRQTLDPDTGWPVGDAEIWLDLSAEDFGPDGAVIDAEGIFWNAQWGASRVAGYAPDGTFLKAVGFDAIQTSCPAFGGPDLATLYCTTAASGLDQSGHEGKTFAADGVARGQREHRVIL